MAESADLLAAIEHPTLTRVLASETVLSQLPAGARYDGVVYVAGTATSQELPGAAVDAIRRLAAFSTALTASMLLAPGARVVVACHSDREVPALVHSGLAGLCKSLALEYAHLQLAHVELLSSGSLASDARRLLDWLADKAPIKVPFEIRLDGDHAYQCQLLDIPARAQTAGVAIKAENSYLITGGLGALGLLIAESLVEQGAGQLLLISRRSRVDEEQQQKIIALQAQGCDVRVIALDVSDAQALGQLIQSCGRSLLPLAGVVHAAGTLMDGRLDSLDGSELEQVIRPKVLGAWWLHQLTAQLPLDFFALFSSVSSTFGNYGQAPYSAANSFLDGLAQWRTQQGLVATSFAWGPWAGAGMAGSDERVSATLSAQGLSPLDPAAGLNAFYKLLAGGIGNPVIVDVQQAACEALLKNPATPALMRHYLSRALPSAPDAKPADRAGAYRAYLERMQPLSAAKATEKLLRESIAQVSGSDLADDCSADSPLIEMGLDSLMAVQLRNKLSTMTGQALPVSLLFDYPTIAKLGEHLLSLLSAAPRLTSELQARQAEAQDEIAIIGIGCRYPGGAVDPRSFWNLLEQGVDAISEVGNARWNSAAFLDADPDAPGKMYSRWGGLLDGIDSFDNAFFNISPQEAISMDPQQRILLEVSWEALEQAGINPAQVDKGGIFVGCGPNEYSHVLNARGAEQTSAYFATGNSISVTAGRLAYFLGWEGPAIAIDTACSSSLVSVALAIDSLRNGECGVALAGGVNLTLSPHTNVALSKARMLSPEGRCKTFDQSADGYVRSEGCGLVVLKPLQAALRDGDRVLGVIKGASINQDGRSQGLTAPNGPSQERVMRAALSRAGVQPQQVQYVEAHGTGTPLGDPIEMRSIETVYGQRDGATPLYVGSVKTNIGHTEAAAGVASLIKLTLMMQRRAIPRNLHLKALNPHFSEALQGAQPPIVIPNRLLPWPTPAPESQCLGAVSSFGFSGTNAHLILAAAPTVAAAPAQPDAPPQAYLLPLSARNNTSLLALTQKYLDLLQTDSPALADLCYSASVSRSHFEVRHALVAATRDDLGQQLQQLLNQGGPGQANRPAKVAFLFTGQGSQYLGMGRALYARAMAFREELDRCDSLMRPYLEVSIRDLLWGEDAERLNDTYYTQPALFALEYALARQWMAWGVMPDYVLGHSVGEYAAACVAGVMNLEDAIKLICARSRLMVEHCEKGTMLVVFADRPTTRGLLEQLGEAARPLSIAAENGPSNTLVSGASETMARFVAHCEHQGVDVQPLKVSHAFHSSMMDPMLAPFKVVADSILYHVPSIGFISTVTGGVVTHECSQADYWVQHVAAPVRFATAVNTLVEQGAGIWLEVGPAAHLVGMAQRCLTDSPVRLLSSLKARRDDATQMLSSLAELYACQVTPQWSQLFDDGHRYQRIALPTYAFQRRRFWPELDAAELFPTHPGVGAQPQVGANALGKKTASAIGDLIYETRFAADAPFPIGDHQLYSTVVVAGASHLAMTALIAEDLRLQPGYEISDVMFPGAMVFAPEEAKSFQYLVSERDDALEVTGFSRTEGSAEKWQKNFACALALREQASLIADNEQPVELASLSHGLDEQVDGQRFYQEMASAGYDLNGCFRWVEHIWRRPGEALSRLRAPRQEDSGWMIPPGLMDAFFQTTAAAAFDERFGLAGREEIFIPFAVDAMRVFKHARGPLWCHVQCLSDAAIDQGSSAAQVYSHRVSVYDESGAPVVRVEALRSKRAPKSVLIDSLKRKQALTYRIDWVAAAAKAQEDGAAPSTAGLWIILGDRGEHGAQLHRCLTHAGLRSLHLSAAAQADDRQDSLHYDQDQPDSLVSIIQRLSEGQPILGVINLQALEQSVDLATQDLSVQQRHLLQPTLLLQQYCLGKGDEPDWIFVSPYDDQPASAAPLPAMLRGLARVMSEECPQARIKHLELPRAEVAANIERLFAELASADDETAIRYLEGQRNVARLAELPCDLVSAQDIRFASDCTYLITGGLGAIGLGLAELIIERGGRHLVLLARRTQAAHAQPQLSRWAALGADVRVMACDVSQPKALQAVLDEIDREMPRLDGLFHCAGILRDGLIATQSWDDFAAPFAAKVDGAWWLHQATQARSLSWFVLFSSAASVFGSPGQANYAAANAFLDQLAVYRRATGLPGLSINWGPWEGEGMANTTGQVANFQRASGVGLLDPQRAYEVLLALAAAQQTNPTVMNIDWSALHASVSERAQRTLLANLIVRKARAGGQHEVNLNKLRQACDPLAPAERALHLEAFVLNVVRDIMALNDSHVLSVTEPLQSEGLDSLMALELRNKLTKVIGRKLPATLLFDYPTVRAMSRYIVEQLYPQDPQQSAAAHSSQYLAQALALKEEEDNFGSLSDDQLAALLADEAI